MHTHIHSSYLTSRSPEEARSAPRSNTISQSYTKPDRDLPVGSNSSDILGPSECPTSDISSTGSGKISPTCFLGDFPLSLKNKKSICYEKDKESKSARVQTANTDYLVLKCF